jgi:hypothetical protein
VRWENFWEILALRRLYGCPGRLGGGKALGKNEGRRPDAEGKVGKS